MKHIKEYNEYKDIDAICQQYGITNYTINNGVVDVDASVNLSSRKLTKLPLQFGKVTGNFYCNYNQLTSLVGAPKEVTHGFYCHSNKLTSLEGAPKTVRGIFDCTNNQLTSLEYAPEKLSGKFYCENNPLPKEIYTYKDHIKEIIKWQGDYNIWRNGKLDPFRFGELIKDILDETY